jgi:hypothetical protein
MSTLARAGIAPDKPDPLPWLPPIEIYEIQSAAQSVEEPFVRLTEQLLWFDAVRDNSAINIQSVLLNLKGEALQKYISEKAELPATVEADQTAETAVSAIANSINQANLRLLLASALLNGVVVHQTNGNDQLKKITKKDWRALNDFSIIPEAHTIISGAAGENFTALNTGHHWKEALRRWNQILTHPWFNIYLSRCIEDLGDDFISAADAETIEQSLRARLVDLAAGETRFLLLEGRYSLATEIVSALSHSGFDKRLLGPSLRPIYSLFQSEIAELESLLNVSEQGNRNHIQAYLKRLEVIKKRWSAIDEFGLIGLKQILDDAIEQAYLQLRIQAQPSVELDTLLVKAIEVASAEALRIRINSFRKELVEVKNRLCYYCGEAPDYESSVVLKGKKETGRSTSGNTTTIHYEIRYGIILRCARCAKLHDFLRSAGFLAGAATLPAIAYPLCSSLYSVGLEGLFIAIFAYFWAVIVGIAIAGSLVVVVIAAILEGISLVLARFITPSEYKRYGNYRDAEAYHSLRNENYGVTPDWRSNAVSYIETN